MNYSYYLMHPFVAGVDYSVIFVCLLAYLFVYQFVSPCFSRLRPLWGLV